MLSRADLEAREQERAELARLMAEFEANKPVKVVEAGATAGITEDELNIRSGAYKGGVSKSAKTAKPQTVRRPQLKPAPITKPAIGTDAMLMELMRWHGLTGTPEVIRRLIKYAHALGREGSASIFARAKR